jgi:hypothetical protein
VWLTGAGRTVENHGNDQGRGYGSKVEAHQCWRSRCGPFMNNIRTIIWLMKVKQKKII